MGKQPVNYLCGTYSEIYNITTDINALVYDSIRAGKFLTYAQPWEDTTSKNLNKYWIPIENLCVIDELDTSKKKYLAIQTLCESMGIPESLLRTQIDYSMARQNWEDQNLI